MKTTQMTYAIRNNKTALIIAMLLFILQPITAQAQETNEQLFWQKVDCRAGDEVTLYLETYPQGAYINEAHICLGKLAQEAQAQRKAQAAQAQRKAQAAQAKREAQAQRKALQKLTGKLIAIPAGSFRMGDLSDDGPSNEKPAHTVRLSAFEIGAHEVTVGQYQTFVKDSGYHVNNDFSQYNKRNDHPVVEVSWEDAQAFINWLNEKTNGNYRLPTEAEWEYAARAGTKSKYSWGDNASQAGAYAWYDDNSGNQTHAVGSKRPNPWGLYDMHGNVWEWVGDWFDSDYYASSPLINPQGPDSGRYRVDRGGGWGYDAGVLRSADRGYYSPGGRGSYLGFRLVRQP